MLSVFHHAEKMKAALEALTRQDLGVPAHEMGHLPQQPERHEHNEYSQLTGIEESALASAGLSIHPGLYVNKGDE